MNTTGANSQDFSRSSSPHPHHLIQIRGIGLLAPHMHFAAEHEMGEIGGDAGERVVGVDEAPVVEGRAVVVEGVELLE